MKIIHKDIKHGEVKLKIENPDDLWYLTYLIDKGDLISGKTERKIKLGGEGDRAKVIKRDVFITIRAEKIEFSNNLRVSGPIEELVEDIPKGSFHTITAEEHFIITIKKKEWLSYQLEKLKESQEDSAPKILICVHDREECYFALMKTSSFQILTQISGNPEKKGEIKPEGDFYSEIIKILEEYKQRYSLKSIILASPAFFKEDLMKKITDPSLKKIIVLATCSSVSKNGIDEVLKRDETKTVLRQDRVAKETALVEELMKNISKGQISVYGFAETEQAANSGAAKELLVCDALIKKAREENTFARLDKIMRTVDSSKGTITLISAEHEAGKRLMGLGGIAAILRYNLNY